MNHLELLIGLLVAVAALAWLASRINVSYPIMLVLGGLATALIRRRDLILFITTRLV